MWHVIAADDIFNQISHLPKSFSTFADISFIENVARNDFLLVTEFQYQARP